MTKTVAEIAPGDHACVVVDSDEQHWEVAAGFVAGGLARREKVVYCDGERSAAPLLRKLREGNLDVENVLRSGQLVVLPTEVMTGLWDMTVAQARALVIETIDGALAEGYRSIRLTDEPAAGTHRPIRQLAELDRMVHEVMQTRPVTMLCQYERHHWSGSEVDELYGLHPVEVVAPAIYDDGLLRITRCAPFSTRVSGEIDFSNRHLVRTIIDKELDQALRALTQTGEIQMHLESLRFADVTSIVQFVQVAESFPQSHRLVLYGVQPGIRRLLDRCGAAFSSQLALREMSHS